MKFGRQRRHDRIANRSALERDAHGNLSQFNSLDSCCHVRNQEEAIVEKGDVDLVIFHLQVPPNEADALVGNNGMVSRSVFRCGVSQRVFD